MRRPIGWIKRDPEHGKIKVEARMFAGKLTFHRQITRYEQFEEFSPSDEDWDTVIEKALNLFQRGKIQDKELKTIQARGKKT